jgi:hypothetical protein
MSDNFTNNYTLGRGKVYFDTFADGTLTKTGERYIGNSPAFTTTQAATMLDHYSSDAGLRVKDASVRLQNDLTGSFTSDNIDPDNLAMMFGTSATTRTTMASTNEGDVLTVSPGLSYQLGSRDNLIEGVRNILNVIMRDNTGTAAAGTLTFSGQPTAGDTLTINGHLSTFVAGAAGANQITLGGNATLTAQTVKEYINDNSGLFHVTATGASTAITLTANTPGVAGNSIGLARSGSYPAVSGSLLTGGLNGGTIPPQGNWEVDMDKGRITIDSDANSITAGTVVVISYDIAASSMAVLSEDGNEVRGALRFVSDNPEGDNRDYYFPYVKITADGDFALKGDTWLTMSFKFDVLVLNASTKRVYVTS